MMNQIAFVYLMLVFAGIAAGNPVVVFCALGMLFVIRHACKVFAKQDAPSPLHPEFVCSTMTALGRKETEASRTFN